MAFAYLLTGGFASIYKYYIEPNPDRTASLITRVDLGGGVTISATSEVWIAGDRLDRIAEVGSYDHGGFETGDGWLDTRTVNVCMLRYALGDPGEVPRSVRVATSGGEVLTIGIRRDCPPEVIREREGGAP
ncbi:hypothetical protein [Phenylobacterium sp.]|uniref:hypothetical protein n=1 Tax=Phenylobacterium sp. TaxID=1871053 RepID=UPI0025E002B5|nr:hypothetical protein [Phenylobacterium sp.]MBX3485733.1 hypothetical protein [Phenylobacterium sp.]